MSQADTGNEVRFTTRIEDKDSIKGTNTKRKSMMLKSALANISNVYLEPISTIESGRQQIDESEETMYTRLTLILVRSYNRALFPLLNFLYSQTKAQLARQF
jgi:hypothetical protein